MEIENIKFVAHGKECFIFKEFYFILSNDK